MLSLRALANQMRAVNPHPSRGLPFVRGNATSQAVPIPTCNTCGKTGHYTINCPEPIQYPCYICGSTEHAKGECIGCKVCGSLDHQASECTERACWRCGSKEHLAAECHRMARVEWPSGAGLPHSRSDLPTLWGHGTYGEGLHRCGSTEHLASACRASPASQTAPICYLCRIPGHRSSDCPTAVCYICRQPGHRQKDCPDGPNTRRPPT
ncbi:hypothetical protein C8R46DRAFT_1208134 [Mycena filopes]|nr:hypothetical protein C8R46DRAFT_1208134 [Mycena filopes]